MQLSENNVGDSLSTMMDIVRLGKRTSYNESDNEEGIRSISLPS